MACTNEKLLRKNVKFMLIRAGNTYTIKITRTHRENITQFMVLEYTSLFTKHSSNSADYAWHFNSEEIAHSMYNWAVMRWG